MLKSNRIGLRPVKMYLLTLDEMKNGKIGKSEKLFDKILKPFVSYCEFEDNINLIDDSNGYNIEDIERLEFYSTKAFFTAKAKEMIKEEKSAAANGEILEMMNEYKETQTAILKKLEKQNEIILQIQRQMYST